MVNNIYLLFEIKNKTWCRKYYWPLWWLWSSRNGNKRCVMKDCDTILEDLPEKGEKDDDENNSIWIE